MLYTPVTLLLVRLWPFLSGGDEERPETAESTFVRGAVSADMIAEGRNSCSDWGMVLAQLDWIGKIGLMGDWLYSIEQEEVDDDDDDDDDDDEMKKTSM